MVEKKNNGIMYDINIIFFYLLKNGINIRYVR